MAALFNNAVPIAMGGVVLVLLMGFVNMFRGGSPNRSQNLMRWRVGLQFLTIVLVLLAIWARG
ncbi:twin transmembrane helix small protein [Alsobacter soli]|nr:twin transmembrane helix small protein [Alsobacter soli]